MAATNQIDMDSDQLRSTYPGLRLSLVGLPQPGLGDVQIQPLVHQHPPLILEIIIKKLKSLLQSLLHVTCLR